MIAEDEPLAREHLRHCLAEIGGNEVVAVCDNGRDVLAALENTAADVVILDVEMPHLSGVEVAEMLDTHGDPGVVFTTAHRDFAPRAFELDAVDYVLKPFDAERIAASLERIRRRSGPARDSAGGDFESLARAFGSASRRYRKLVLRVGGKVRLVDVDDVQYVNSEGDYCVLSVGRDSIMVRDALRELETQLLPLGFMRIHRRVLINLRYLREIRPWRHGDHEFVMTNGTVFRSGPTFRAFVHRLIGRRSPL